MAGRVVMGLFLLLCIGSCFPASSATAQEVPEFSGLIAFVSNRDGDDELFVVRPDGTGLRQLTHNRRPDYTPAWAPGGRRVVFVRGRGRKGPALMIKRLAGGHALHIATRWNHVEDPAWSPDGRWIAFESGDGGEDGSSLYAWNTDTRRTIVLAWVNDNSYNGNPDWSPTGDRFAWRESNDPGGEIYYEYLTDRDGGYEHLASTWSRYSNRISWSPDGESLLFDDINDELPHPDPEGWDIYRVPSSGGISELVLGGKGDQVLGSWSPDGSHVVYYSDQAGDFDVYIANTKGEPIVQLTHSDASDRSPAWWWPHDGQ